MWRWLLSACCSCSVLRSSPTSAICNDAKAATMRIASFGIAQIPSDDQIRNLLDPIAPKHLRVPFWAILSS